MCLFTQPVEQVSGTQIFARVIGTTPPRQVLVYSMQFSAAGDLAMVLPLATPPNSAEDAVEFVSLEEYPKFFEEMGSGFPGGVTIGGPPSRGPGNAAPTLVVHDVGAFEASFVPKQADFSRLDERFRLPDGVWASLPGGADYGYAVFKLKAGKDQKVHPMALTFPTRNTQQIFFPTAHLHGGAWERRAKFDHDLFFQGSDEMRLPLAFDTGTHRFGRLAGQVLGVAGGAKPAVTSHQTASEFMTGLPEGQILVDVDHKVRRFQLRERLPNRDVTLWPRYHERAGSYA